MDCGAEDPNFQIPGATLTPVGFTLSFEDEIFVNFYYQVSDMTNVVEQGMLVFINNPGTASIAAADKIYTGSVASGSRFMNSTDGIAAKEMGDDRYYCAYVKLSNGTYAYSEPVQYSPKTYAANMLASNTASQKQKELCVAMLNYGAAAQVFFNYKTGNLMNAGLTAEQKAMVTAYDASYFKGAIAADPGKTGNFAATAGFSGKSASVSFEGAFAINYYLMPSAAVSGDMTLYIWDAAAYASEASLTTGNATAVVTAVKQSDGSYWGNISGIAAKNLDSTYYAAGVYTDASGNRCCTGVVAYSLSRYCMNNAEGSMGALAQATAMYGYYAAAYFAK